MTPRRTALSRWAWRPSWCGPWPTWATPGPPSCSAKPAAYLLPLLHTLIGQQAQVQAQERAALERAAADAATRDAPAPKRPKRKDPMHTRHFKAATPGALILCPTRELAQQVAHDAIDLARHCRGLRVANVVGGMP